MFAGWLKGLFIGQAVIAVVLGGVAAFDAFPWFTIDISLRALGFWSFWLFIIPSLRARRPKGWEKFALDIAFLGSPIVTIGAPFVTKDPALIWGANLVLLVGAYAAAFALRDADLGSNAGFSGALNALDFGTGQERGIRGEARERYFAQQKAAKEEGGEGEKQGGRDRGSAVSHAGGAALAGGEFVRKSSRLCFYAECSLCLPLSATEEARV